MWKLLIFDGFKMELKLLIQFNWKQTNEKEAKCL